MKTYREFHWETPITDIGRRLREIVRTEKSSFKKLTGYGSTSNSSKSRQAAIKSLTKMKSEGLINGFLPGKVKSKLLKQNDYFYEEKQIFTLIIVTKKFIFNIVWCHLFIWSIDTKISRSFFYISTLLFIYKKESYR